MSTALLLAVTAVGWAVPSDRLAGGSRYETAAAISQEEFPQGAERVHLARASAPLVDALAGGTLTGGPILLVPPTLPVPDAVHAEIARLDPDEIVALGGPAALAEEVVQAAADGRATRRLAGPSRYHTAVEISRHGFPDGAGVAYLARAQTPLVDALAGGSLTGGPILLVPPCAPVPDVVVAELDRLDPDRVVALGGTGAVCDDVLTEAADGRDAGRLAGASRYDTAVAIANAQFGDGAGDVYLARATDPLVDALAGGVLTGGPVLLVPPSGDLPAEVAVEIARLDPQRVIALGGTSAIAAGTLEFAAAAPQCPDPPQDEPGHLHDLVSCRPDIAVIQNTAGVNTIVFDVLRPVDDSWDTVGSFDPEFQRSQYALRDLGLSDSFARTVCLDLWDGQLAEYHCQPVDPLPWLADDSFGPVELSETTPDDAVAAIAPTFGPPTDRSTGASGTGETCDVLSWDGFTLVGTSGRITGYVYRDTTTPPLSSTERLQLNDGVARLVYRLDASAPRETSHGWQSFFDADDPHHGGMVVTTSGPANADRVTAIHGGHTCAAG